MKIIDDLDNLKGKTISFNLESWNDNIFVLGTAEDEMLFIEAEWNSSREEPMLRVLNFGQAVNAIKKERYLFDVIENEKPGILKDFTNEIKMIEEKRKEEADYRKYKELDKKFRKRLISEGAIF